MKIPSLRSALIWLLPFLAACEGPARAGAPAAEWPMWGGTAERNQVNHGAKGIPDTWDAEKGTNILWSAALGSRANGNPVVAGGKVFVGTNNDRPRDPEVEGDRGILLCLRASDGAFLWQAVHDKLESGRANDWPEEGICSSPCVVGNRVYYVSNRCELVCADVEGFLDGKNDGPFQGETLKGKGDADLIWVLDMIRDLGVFPHNMATSSPVVHGDLVLIHTSNGVDEEDHEKLPKPEAPSFIAVDKETGRVVWKDASPGKGILHGQWSSPTVATIGGRPQAIFPGGDGVLYAFEPATGKPLWRFEANPKAAKYAIDGKGDRNPYVATAVASDGVLYIALGDDPQFGDGPGHLHAIDPEAGLAKAGPSGPGPVDITATGALWHLGGKEFRRTISCASVQDGLVYASTMSGFLHAIDRGTGKIVWTEDLFAPIWGSPAVIDGKVFIGTEDGDVVVLQAGREKKVLAKNPMGSSVYGTAVAAGNVLYVASRSTLFAIGRKV